MLERVSSLDLDQCSFKMENGSISVFSALREERWVFASRCSTGFTVASHVTSLLQKLDLF